MYKLYWCPDSGSFAPHVLLEECGVPYERVLIDIRAGDQRRPDYLAVNPQGRVPAMALPDGTVMTESAAMTLYLADRYRDAGLAPAADEADRAPFLRWLLFMATGLYEADLRYYHADRYADAPDSVAEVKAVAGRELDGLWALLAEAVGHGPYLLGARFSALDVYLLMLVTWFESPETLLARHANIARLCDLVRERPAVGRLWDDYRRG